MKSIQRLSFVAVTFFLAACSNSTSTNDLCRGVIPAYQVDGRSVHFDPKGEAEWNDPSISGASAKTSYQLVAQTSQEHRASHTVRHAAIISTQNAGSGTFYFLSIHEYLGCDSEQVAEVFLGDRIDIDTLLIEHSKQESNLVSYVVSFYSHAETEAMAEKPSVYQKKQFVLKEGELVTLVNSN